MTIQTIAAAVDFLICRGQPLTQAGTRWYLDGQHLSGKELLALARQLDGGDGGSKYGNRKASGDGVEFDSVAEMRYYQVLAARQAAGEITELELQPRFEVIPGFRDMAGRRHAPRHYTADFQYKEQGRIVVVEVKGFKTEAYILRRTLFLFQYGHICFQEIEA